ncbi:uncharacterized protein LOC118434185 isoform X2 [Folsomia candida]|uniref:uncharacterized protein LOC118434185 isoform X2 n=1 Tax=Folsomia candida TaxID=158441 RepID=UPI0016051879|nr:uncharacterized protein LOC118434185 isoform X2 [Folsomia candida]
MAILLMGDPNDYRKPHMTLMHAPSLELIVQDDSSTPVIDLKETENKINATSMFIFGDDTECILVKGKKKTQIRIRTGALNVKDHIPDEVEKNDPGYLGYEGTFCKLSYPHINTNLDLVEGASTPPKVEDQQARVSYALEALAVRNGEDAVVSRCENPDNYTNYTKKLVTERKEQIVNFTTKGDEKELLDPDLLLYFNKSGRLPEADPVGRGYTTVNKDVYPPTTDPCVDWTVTLICYDLPSPPGPPPKCPQPPVEEKCEKLNNCSACDAEQIERVVKIHKLNVEAERTNPDPAIPQKDKDDASALIIIPLNNIVS